MYALRPLLLALLRRGSARRVRRIVAFPDEEPLLLAVKEPELEPEPEEPLPPPSSALAVEPSLSSRFCPSSPPPSPPPLLTDEHAPIKPTIASPAPATRHALDSKGHKTLSPASRRFTTRQVRAK